MRLYKLTDANGQTRGRTQWGEGVTHTSPGSGDLCTAGWVHAYTDPLLALLLNPIHANFEHPRLWEAEGEVGKSDHGLKVGCASLTTVREIPVPEITTEQRVRFAILCAKAVSRDEAWNRWADAWLDGSDRSRSAAAAEARARAAWSAAWAAWAAEAATAAWASAAEAAAWAAEAAAAEAAAPDLPALARQAMEATA